MDFCALLQPVLEDTEPLGETSSVCVWTLFAREGSLCLTFQPYSKQAGMEDQASLQRPAENKQAFSPLAVCSLSCLHLKRLRLFLCNICQSVRKVRIFFHLSSVLYA